MRRRATRFALAAPVLMIAALAATPARADGWPGPGIAGRSPGGAAAQVGPRRDPDPWFGLDKALHFGASATLAGGGYGVAALVTPRVPVRLAVGATVALGAGIAKETYDALGFGDPSWRDLAWDVLGTAAGLGLSVALDFAVRPDRF